MFIFPSVKGSLRTARGDAALGDDGRNVPRGRDVEGRIEHLHAFRCHPAAGEVRHFGRGPLFDWGSPPARRAQVDVLTGAAT